ncbi:hypothetical protein FHG87_003257 [Trinorchestia longiramus]|nr:hypothetical protein FHG87_003257 [Trinorchestia longiramus]
MTIVQRRATVLCCSYVVAAAPRLACSLYSTSTDQNLYKLTPKYLRLDVLSSKKKQLPSAERVMQHIQDVYGATERQCRVLIRSPTLVALPEHTILATITALKENNISLQQLLRIPWILTIEKSILTIEKSILIIE